jgi:hypothetical protein
MIENIRSGGVLAPPRFDFYTHRGAPSFGEFSERHSVDGMGPVTLPSGEQCWPTGAIFLPATGQMFDPPLEPLRLAELREAHARQFLADAVKTFRACQNAARQNPVGHDWPADLRRLKGVADRARQLAQQRHEEYETACGRTAEWRRQQRELSAQIERDRQRQEQARLAALQAIASIELSGDDPTDPNDDE